LPEEASTGEIPHKLAKEASLFNLWGLSPVTISSVAACRRYRCPSQRDQLRSYLRHQPIELCVQLGDLS
jgi:hypothetical protein